jgi:hypothetical protein
MLFGSLDFVYTGPEESVVGNVYTRPTHPTASMTAVGHTAFVCGFMGDTIRAMLGPKPTQERFRLAAYYLSDQRVCAADLGRVHGVVQRHVPKRTTRSPG